MHAFRTLIEENDDRGLAGVENGYMTEGVEDSIDDEKQGNVLGVRALWMAG